MPSRNSLANQSSTKPLASGLVKGREVVDIVVAQFDELFAQGLQLDAGQELGQFGRYLHVHSNRPCFGPCSVAERPRQRLGHDDQT